MKIFSYNEISEIFGYTVEHDHVSMIELVDRVGKGVADEIAKRYTSEAKMIIFAGWDTNGAYALSAARYLLDNGYRPEIYLFNIGGERLTPNCANARKLLKKSYPRCRLHEIEQSFETPDLDADCIVIDGIFGIELQRPLPKSLGLLMRTINESGATIVSIDIPSGLFSEWNSNNVISRDIIHATLTLAVQFPSLSFFMDENAELIGEWRVLDIGLSPEAIRNATFQYYLVTDKDVRHLLRPRRPDTSKADYGSALICAGSYGMMGAAVLAARGCLRAGAGKVTCYGPACGYQIMQTAVPCAMYLSDTHDNELSNIKPSHKFTAIAIGPGIGVNDTTINAFDSFLKMCNARHQPLVIDADALNCIARRPTLLNSLPEFSVLTPHAGEFDRIFGAQPSSESRIRRALEVAAYHNVIILLKGHYTAVIRPDGRIYFNSSGTPALATPGSGDVLTGVITALMAQDYKSEIAATLGAYIHGRAGELAERVNGTYGVTAGDVADRVGAAIRDIMMPPTDNQ